MTDQNDDTNPVLTSPASNSVLEETIQKTARLTKINLLITILGLGGLGYLHFSDKAATDDAIARSKATLKQEVLSDMKNGMATTQQLQGLVEKNSSLELKLDSLVEQISNLDAKTAELQTEIQKNSNLRTKLAELQASMKSKKAPAKPAPKSAPKKPLKKGRK